MQDDGKKLDIVLSLIIDGIINYTLRISGRLLYVANELNACKMWLAISLAA